MLIAAGPAVVAGVVSTTVSTLTEGVLKAMFIAKIKTATLVLCGVAAFGVSTGGVYYQTQAGAADSLQVDRVAQENRISSSEPRDREIDKLKRENQQLRDMLERERDRKTAYREKFNTFVKDWMPTIQTALATKSDDPDQDESDAPDKPGKNSALKKELRDKMQAELDELKKVTQDKYQLDLQAQLKALDAKQKALEVQRKQLDAQLKALQAQRRQLEQEQRKMRETLRREDSEKRAKIMREQAEKMKEGPRREAELKAKLMREQAANQNQSKNKAVEKPASGDKLDLILQRLERMEKRLNRLERDRD